MIAVVLESLAGAAAAGAGFAIADHAARALFGRDARILRARRRDARRVQLAHARADLERAGRC